MPIAGRERYDQGFQSAQHGHNLVPLYSPHLTGIDVKPVMRTTEKPTTERVVLAQFGNGFSLMRMGALGAVLWMLLSQEHRQPDYSELGATARRSGGICSVRRSGFHTEEPACALCFVNEAN